MRPVTRTPPMVAVVALMLLLAPVALAGGGGCTPPQHMNGGKCTDPNWTSNYMSANNAPNVGTPTVTFTVPSRSMSNAPGGKGAYFDAMGYFRADKLTLTITSSNPDLYVIVREDDVFHSEVNLNANAGADMVFEARGDWNGRGKWFFSIVNWGAANANWDQNIITKIELSCASGANFKQEGSYKQCFAAKICEDYYHLHSGQCQYTSKLAGSKVLIAESGSTSGVKKYVGLASGGLYSLKFKEHLEYDFNNYDTRSTKMEIKIDADAFNEAPNLWIRVMSGQTLIDDFETAAGVTKVLTAPTSSLYGGFQPGQWNFQVANWAPNGAAQVFRPSRLQIKLFCDGEPAFYEQAIGAEATSRYQACMITVPPFNDAGDCYGYGQNWQNKGCQQPIYDFSPANALQVELDASSSDNSKTYIGKTDLSQEIAPKQVLWVDTKVQSSRINVQLQNPQGNTPTDLEVRVMYATGSEEPSFSQTEKGFSGGGSQSWNMYMAGQNYQNYGKWRVVVVNWAADPVTVPFDWLKITYYCESWGSFTDQGDGITACEEIPCPNGKRKYAGPDGALMCIAPIRVGTFDATSSPGATANKLVFAGKTASITLQPKESVLFQIKQRADLLILNTQPDEENPDLWVRVLAQGKLVEYPKEVKMGAVVDDWMKNYMTTSGDSWVKGQFHVEVVNWGTTPQVFKSANFGATLQCNQETDVFAEGPGGVIACFKRCDLGKVFMWNGAVWDCTLASFPYESTIPATLSQPTADTRVLTTNAEFVKVNGMSGLSIFADNLRSNNFEVTVKPDSTFTSNSGWWAVVFNGDQIIDSWYLSEQSYTGATRRYTSTTTDANQGKWRLAIGFYQDYSVSSWWFAGDRVTVKYYCDFGDFKSDGGGLESCLYLPCADALKHRRSDGSCYPIDLETNPVELAVAPVVAPAGLKGFTGTTATPVSIEPGKAVQVFDLSEIRADTLTLTVARPASEFIFLQVFENGKFVEEYFPTGQAKVFKATKPTAHRSARTLDTASGYGQWKIAIVNQALAADGSQEFVPTSMSVSLSCEDNTEFDGNSVDSCIVEALPPTPPPTPPTPPPTPPTPPPTPPTPPPTPPTPPSPAPPALFCTYSETVGFNPWERWNVFSLVGKLTLDGARVEGRVAGVGEVEARGGAMVHTKKEAFIPKSADRAAGGAWSITAGAGVTLDGATTQVANGGIEAAGNIDKANGAAFTGSEAVEAPTKSEAGELTTAAAAYFTERSETWADLAPSWIVSELTATELTVQLHGKVNVVEVASVAEMENVEKITLTGHPVGTVIVNIKGTGTLTLKPALQVTFEGHGANGPEPPTFARVLFNVVEATQVQFAAGAVGTGPLHVSILAPKAVVTFSADAPEVKGGLVAKSVTAHNSFASHPFGTLARRLAAPVPLPPAPKRRTTAGGASKTACLWHAL